MKLFDPVVPLAFVSGLSRSPACLDSEKQLGLGTNFSNTPYLSTNPSSSYPDLSATANKPGGYQHFRRARAGEGKLIHLWEHDRHRHDHGHHHRFRHGVENKLTQTDTCPSPAVVSCSAAASSTNTCCVVSPGGALVHVQLWDTGMGLTDSFSIHGLWPDTCTGEYLENCDSSRDYSASEITGQLSSSLKSYMEEYWYSDDESSEDFWAHEWKEHGTCVSTLEPSCFSNYETAAEVEPFFETVVGVFKSLNTYQALVDAGITPSQETTYSASDMQNAITQGTTYTPDLVCSDSGELTSVQYYLRARGPLQDGEFEQGSPTRTSSCPEQITWPPKTVSNNEIM